MQGEFRTFDTARRLPAQPLQPVIDPAGWSPEELGPVARWSCRISEGDVTELADAVASVRRRHIPLAASSQENFRLNERRAAVLADVKRELTDGRGLVMLQGFPVETFDREAIAAAYLGIGSYLGVAMSQNAQGQILGHVKDLGGN